MKPGKPGKPGSAPPHPPPASLPTWLRHSLGGFAGLCALLLAADFVFDRPVLHALEHPGFYSLFGFLACVALVETAKIMRRFLMRPPDYYDRRD